VKYDVYPATIAMRTHCHTVMRRRTFISWEGGAPARGPKEPRSQDGRRREDDDLPGARR